MFDQHRSVSLLLQAGLETMCMGLLVITLLTTAVIIATVLQSAFYF